MAIGPEWCLEFTLKATNTTCKVYGNGEAVGTLSALLFLVNKNITEVEHEFTTTGKMLGEEK